MQRILGPKFVKKANSWCVTVFKAHQKNQKAEEIQTVTFHVTKEDADKFIEQQIAVDNPILV